MDVYGILTLEPGFEWESALLWGLFALVLLYLARTHAHRLFFGVSRALARALRGLAALIWRLRRRAVTLQTEMLNSAAQAAAARSVKRDYRRLTGTVRGELSDFPSLSRQVGELCVRMEQDYEASTEVPPVPPNWLEAVDAVAHSGRGADPALANILDAMHSTLTRASHDALEEYRYASRKRHNSLRRIAPSWRKATRVLERMERTVGELDDRMTAADEHWQAFEQVRQMPLKPSLSLQLRHLTYFLLALAMLAGFGVVAGGQLALLHSPLNRLLAGEPAVLGQSLGTVAAWALVCAPVLLGGLLLELGRMTRLLPILGGLPSRLRLRAMSWLAALAILILVFQALLVALGGHTPVEPPLPPGAAPVLAAVGLSVLLGLLLMAIELPFETALRSGRQVGMSLLIAILGLGAILARVTAWVVHLVGLIAVRAYDLVIFLPLVIDEAWAARRRRNHAVEASDTTEERLES